MPIYAQKTNNGKCTCNLTVNQYGWNQTVVIDWSNLMPLPSLLSNSCDKITSFSESPKIEGLISLSYIDSSDADAKAIEVFNQEIFGNSYWRYLDVTKSIKMQIPYGKCYKFSLTIDNLIFPKVQGTNEKNKFLKTNIRTTVTDTFIFRQKEPSESYGSELDKYLFWPWQNER